MSVAAQSRTPVTPGSTYAGQWRRRLATSPVLSPRAALDVARGDTVVVAVAHPDDETLAMGAALARLARDGVHVHLVVMTAGEAALDHVGVQVPGLAARRRGELTAAAAALGAVSSDVVGLPDGELAGHGDAMDAVLRTAVEERGARCLATLWRHDPHPDHQAVSRAAGRVAASTAAVLSEFGLWTTHWTDPEDVRDEVVLVESGEQPVLAKREALSCYRSQSEPLTAHVEAVLPSDVLGWPHEYVVRPAVPPSPPPAMPDFDGLYAADADPWQVATSWYEQRKLAVLLATLPQQRYRRAWEPGCGPGVVSAALADRVDELVASDGSLAAVALARRRPGMPAHVRFEHSQLPQVPVEGPVDLVVVAEFLYYVEDLSAALDALWSLCVPGTHVVFLHWAHRPHDAYRSGPEMHARICLDSQRRNAFKVISHTDRDFLLDVYEVHA